MNTQGKERKRQAMQERESINTQKKKSLKIFFIGNGLQQ